MSFDLPWALAALPLVVALVVLDALRPWRTRASRKVAAAITRVGLLGALVVSLAGPRGGAQTRAPTFVFVLDRSGSIDDARLAQGARALGELADQVPAGARRALVWMDGRVEVAVDPEAPWTIDVPARTEAMEDSDLGAAIFLSLALIDPAGGGRVVLATDGADTVGRATQAAREAARRGVPIDVLDLPEPEGELALIDVELGATVVRPGEAIEGWITVRAPRDGGRAAISIALDDRVIERRDLDLSPGRTERFRFEHALPTDAPPGRRHLETRLAAQGGSEPAPLRHTTALTVGSPPTVLVVTDQEREVAAVNAVLAAQSMQVRLRAADAARAEDLPEVDLVILGDVAAQLSPGGAPPLRPDFIDALRRWVSSGGGLITLGGDRTYELGGWGATPLARIVPLDLSPNAEDIEPAVTVVHVIDNSASMGDWTGHQRKMALANEGTIASMRLLRPRDFIEVMAVNTEVARALPLQPATDPARMAAAIRGIQPRGGGIYVYTSLLAAEQTLQTAQSPLKHIILYSDAQDAEEKVAGIEMGWGPGPNAFQIAERMRRRGVTLSVIALGDPRDQDVPFLRQLATLGGGRFRITREASELRALYVEETRQLVQSVVHDSSFQARRVASHPAVEGVQFEGAPPFLGYVEVRARDTATVVLEGPGQQPILATWQYGLGHVASFATDLGPRWATRWIEYAAYSRWVAQLARWALRPPVARGAVVELSPHPRGARVEIQRLDDDGLARDEAALQATITAPGGPARDLPLRPLEPGRWTGIIQGERGAVYDLAMKTGDQPVSVERIILPDAIERTKRPGTTLRDVVEVGAGEVSPQTLGSAGVAIGSPRALWWIPLLLAALLLPLDAWLRRPARRP